MKHGLPICAILLAALPAAGQGFSNQGAAVSIGAGTQMTVAGNVVVGPGGTIDNVGTLSFTGNWDNSAGAGVLTPGTGTVQLTGPATQQIGGSSATTFHTLDLSGSTGPVTLASNISVGNDAGILQLGSTQLRLSSKVLTLNNGTTGGLTYGTGQLISETTPAAGYGRLVWVIGANTGTYTIPMGTGTTSLPVTATITAAGAGATGSLDVTTYPTPPNNQPLPTGITTLQGNANKALDRFWVVQPSNYTLTPTATLTFGYQDSEWNTAPNTIVESQLRLQHWNGSGWDLPQGSVSTATNVLTSAPQNTFGIFASADFASPLPVQLREFTAQAQGNNGLLSWATAAELHNQGFSVEASLDGKTFRTLGFVAGHGTTTTEQHYRFTDVGAAQRGSRQYYRLQQLDQDGTSSYSPVRVVTFGQPGTNALAVWPNPAKSSYTILLTAAHAQPALVTVHDVLGRKVAELPVQLQAGENQLPTAFGPDQASGVYLLSTVLDGQTIRTRLVRE